MHRPHLRGGRAARRACCRCCPAGPTSARRCVTAPARCGSSRSPARPRPAAGSASWPASHLKRAHLELGGNSALIVLDDADVDEAVNLAAWGSFFHQGQICMTTGRHLVHERLYDDFVERLADKAGHLPVGDPAREEVALGPVIDAGQRDKIHGLVTASAGDRRAARGRRHVREPVLLADRAGRRQPGHPRVRRGDLRPGRAGRPLQHASTRRSRWPRPPSTGCRSAS